MNINPAQFRHYFPHLLENTEQIQTLLDTLTYHKAPSSEVLYRYGEPADTFYLIWRGRLQLAMGTPLGSLGPGQIVGAEYMIAPGPALATVTVTETSVLLSLDHAGMQQLRKNYPHLGESAAAQPFAGSSETPACLRARPD